MPIKCSLFFPMQLLVTCLSVDTRDRGLDLILLTLLSIEPPIPFLYTNYIKGFANKSVIQAALKLTNLVITLNTII